MAKKATENDRCKLLSDMPVNEAGRTDKLNFDTIASVLVEAAIDTESSLTIGIYGEWGSGKTSLMRLMQEKVDKEPNAIAVWFNAWQYEKEEHLIIPLVATFKKKLDDAIEKRKLGKQDWTGLVKLRDALRAIAYGVSVKGKLKIPFVSEAEVNLSPKDMIERYQDLLDESVLGRSLYYDAFDKFAECTKSCKAPRIVVFVDDLDRCFPKNALELLEHIKLVLNQQGFTFVLGIYREAIQAAVLEKSEKTRDLPQNYLDKIVQVEICVPKRNDKDLSKFIKHLVVQTEIFPEGIHEDLIALIEKSSAHNPRTIVRQLNRIILLHSILNKGGDKFDILHILIHVATDDPRLEYFCAYLDYSIAGDKNNKYVCSYLAEKLDGNQVDVMTWCDEFGKSETADNVPIRADILKVIADAFRRFPHLFNLLKTPKGLEWLRDKELRQNLREISETTKPQRIADVDKRLNAQQAVGEIRSRMVPIKGETFMMGEKDGKDNPQHKVILSDFSICSMQVTQEQYEAIMGINPSYFKGKDLPVERVSWHDAVAFCKKLSEISGEQYRLPTEAEWEYCCRAGSDTEYCFGDDEANLGEYAWYSDNSAGETHPVGTKKPNNWGLYDMHGNVWEWCSDWYGEYPEGDTTDPSGPKKGQGRVLRGGSWNLVAPCCRAAYRLRDTPANRSSIFGFGVVASPSTL